MRVEGRMEVRRVVAMEIKGREEKVRRHMMAGRMEARMEKSWR